MAFIRMLRERFEEFQGTPRANCWWTGFTDLGYDPDLGYGCVLHTADGGAVRLVWAFIAAFCSTGLP
jgi:hypothetical protein